MMLTVEQTVNSCSFTVSIAKCIFDTDYILLHFFEKNKLEMSINLVSVSGL